MSIENAKEFLQRMREDSEFQNKMGSFASRDEAHPYLKEEGYDFTAEEAKIAMKEFSTVGEDGELSDKQLEHVAGGCHVIKQTTGVASCHLSMLKNPRKSSDAPDFFRFLKLAFEDVEKK